MEDKKITKKEIQTGIGVIRRYMEPFRREFITLFILGLVSAVANGFIPYVTGRFFDALIKVSQHEIAVAESGLPLWGILLGVWVLVQLIANNIDWIIDRLRRRVTLNIHLNIQTEGFAHFFRLPLAYHKNAHINGEIQKVSLVGWRTQSILSMTVNIAPQFLSIFIGLALAASINGLLAGILLLGVLLYVLLLTKILLPIASIESLGHRLWDEGWSAAASAVHQIESVKQAAAETHETNKVRESLLGHTYKIWYRLEKIWSNVNFFQRIIVFLTQLTVFIFSIHLVSNNTITVGQLIALNGYANMFFGPFVALGHSWQTIQNGILAAARAEEVLAQPEEVYVPPDARVPESFAGDVHFDNVSFAYAPDQSPIVKDISFHARPGAVVAFVGESGVGKSTTVSLISGYYFPTTGSVSIDGVDTRQFDLRILREHIGVVPQEVALFNDSIKANIAYGTFGASEEEIKTAAREAHIDEFITALPEGYETVVGERGVKLSVGQKQRVAIARAMLRDPAILILDEPTSALDARTEQLVTEALERLMKGRTTFIIAHRLSTVRKADTILVFDKGRIAESGSHEALLEKGGIYRRLHDYQIGLH